MMSSVLMLKSQLAVRMPTGRRPARRSSTSAARKDRSRSTPGGRGGVGFVDPGVDADLVALVSDGADFVGVEQGGDGGVEERGLDAVLGEDGADAGHAAAVTVMALADPHGALVSVAERDGVVVGIEGEGDGAAGAAGPGGGGEAAAGAGAGGHAAPDGLGPFPGGAGGVVGHAVISVEACPPVQDGLQGSDANALVRASTLV